MTSAIVLDTGPLGLLVQRPGVRVADTCRTWLAGHVSRGVQVVVPEVADYEVRRELIRLRLTAALVRLDEFIASPGVRYLPLTTEAMRHAAHLWAQARQQGQPTADPHALDIDVILAAQALRAGLPAGYVVATTNLAHLSRFVPAEAWSNL